MSTPSTSWAEKVDPSEGGRFERLAEQLRDLQRARAKGGAAARALHAKASLGVEAELQVLGNLPPHARQGLFAEPATYRAYVRFSNGAGVRQPDKTPACAGSQSRWSA